MCLATVLQGGDESTSALTFTPDGRMLLCGGGDEILHLWDITKGRRVRSMVGHFGSITAIACTPDGRKAVTASFDKTLRVWDLASGVCRMTFREHDGFVEGVDVSSDGRFVVSADYNGVLMRWQLAASRSAPFVPVRPRSSAEVSEADSAFKSLMARAERALAKGELQAAARAVSEARQLPEHERSSRAVDLWHRIGQHGAVTGLRGAWHVRTFESQSNVETVAVSPVKPTQIASGGWDKCVRVWDVETGECLKEYGIDDKLVGCVCYSPDGRWVYAGDKEGGVSAIDLESRRLHRHKRHRGEVTSLLCSDDGKRIISSGLDGDVHIHKAPHGSRILSIPGMKFQWQMSWVKIFIHGMALTSDGKLVLARGGFNGYGDDTNLLQYSIVGKSAHEHRLDSQHDNWVWSIASSYDGRRLLTASRDATLRLWQQPLGTVDPKVLRGHTDWVRSAVFTPDGRFALSGADDTTVRVWDLATTECVTVLTGHRGPVLGVACTPDGRYALSASEDGTVRVWALDWQYALKQPS